VLFERALVFKFVTTCLTNPVVLLVCLIHMSIPFLRTAVPGEGRIALIMKADVRRQISQNMQPVRN
jgi:sugar phosphate permease